MTTTHYPDVSNWQAGLSLAGAPAAMAKATEGTWYRDPTYAGFKAQMAGKPFAGYHFLRRGDATGQAAYAHAAVGDVPLMVDVEKADDGTWPSLDETYAFIDAYRAGGGLVGTAYIPHWFWEGEWGSPSLAGLTQRGIGLISSNYTTYSDDGPGWAPYGGVTPAIWQYSSTYPFNGQGVDMNAFKGTVAELRALFGGRSTREDDGMKFYHAASGAIYQDKGLVHPVSHKPVLRHVPSMPEWQEYQRFGYASTEIGGEPDWNVWAKEEELPAASTGGSGPLKVELSGTATPAV